MKDELLDAVKELVDSVHGFLNSFDGNDDCHIEAMSASVADVLDKARGIPELREWAEAVAAKQAATQQAFMEQLDAEERSLPAS